MKEWTRKRGILRHRPYVRRRAEGHRGASADFARAVTAFGEVSRELSAARLPPHKVHFADFVAAAISLVLQDPQARSHVLTEGARPASNWNSIKLEQVVSIKRSETRTSGEVLDDFGTFFRAHDAMKG